MGLIYGESMHDAVGPKNTTQLVYLEPFDFVDSSLQALKDSLISYFNLSIGLRMPDWSEVVVNMKITIELSKESVIKLPSIISNDDMTQTKSTNDKTFTRSCECPLSDPGEWLHLNPLDKVVNNHNGIFFLPDDQWK